MKKSILYIAFIIGLSVMVSGCGSKSESVSPLGKQIVGEWHLSVWSGEAPQNFDAYIVLNQDKTFVIYQQIEDVGYKKYSGTYRLKKSVLSGVYNDRTPWGSSYDVVYNETNSTLTLTGTAGSAIEISVYVQATVPASVKNDATAVARVRSEGFIPLL